MYDNKHGMTDQDWAIIARREKDASENETLICVARNQIEECLKVLRTACPEGTRLRATLVGDSFTLAAWSPHGMSEAMKNNGVQEW